MEVQIIGTKDARPAVMEVSEVLLEASLPVVITSHAGKNMAVVSKLVNLTETTDLTVLVGRQRLILDILVSDANSGDQRNSTR